MGAEYCYQLAKQGFSLVLVSRTREKLEKVKNIVLLINPKVSVRIVVADFSGNANPEFYKSLLNNIEQGGPLDIGLWVINAGTMVGGDFNRVDIKNTKNMLDVNIYQYAVLAHYAQKQLAKRPQKGGLLLVGSGAGWNYFVGTCVYSATKAFVLYLLEGLAAE